MINLGFHLTSGSRTHVRFQFSTHEAAGGNVAPSSAFEAADIRIYRAADGAAYSATQRSSANGITMTSPFDSLTGYHDIDIDLTDNTDAGFYAAGYSYTVVLAPDETVDSQTITAIPIATFEIGVPTANVTQWLGTGAATPTVAGVPEVDVTHLLGTGWLTPGTAGTPDVNVKLVSGDQTAADTLELFAEALDQATGQLDNGSLADDTISAAKIASDAITAAKIATGAIDADAIAADAITAAKIAAGAIDAATFAADVDAEILSYIVDDATRIDASALNTASVTTVPAILVDTNELQTDWTNGGRLDLIVDDILVDTGTTLQGELDGIQADTEDIQTRLPAALVNSRMDCTIDGTGMESGAITALLTTAMTEAYNTDGAAPTVAQALFLIMQILSESSVSSTTLTVKKLDGSTTAATFTLNDATNPTSITRAS